MPPTFEQYFLNRDFSAVKRLILLQGDLGPEGLVFLFLASVFSKMGLDLIVALMISGKCIYLPAFLSTTSLN